jgi:hypothetical protein
MTERSILMKKILIISVLFFGLLGSALFFGNKMDTAGKYNDLPTQHSFELAGKYNDLPTQHSFELAGKYNDLPTQHSFEMA